MVPLFSLFQNLLHEGYTISEISTMFTVYIRQYNLSEDEAIWTQYSPCPLRIRTRVLPFSSPSRASASPTHK